MTPPNYKEQDFEEHIEQHLLRSGYNKQLSSEYDKESCLIPAETIQFLKSSQPNEYEKLYSYLGADTDKKIQYRLTNELAKLGSLHVLRKGFKTRGVHFRMAFFEPASGMNPDALKLYKENRFSIVRQLKYSSHNENSLDIGILLNGIPIITAELKNSLTGQSVENAIKQYKNDRDPKEPLFKFKRCLVHFAIGNEKAFMTTRLQGGKTRFLPFNLDTENPVNPTGHKTAYIWEDILQPATLLDLIQNYIHIQTNTDKYYDKESGKVKEREYQVCIFPRFHQLDAVRKMLAALKKDGVGNSYLIQHSAGSGKSNSIAWLSHHLASFYQKQSDTERLFDSIVVVTDRRVLDRQLRNTIKQFEQTKGVVKPIDKNSAQLKEALELGKDIIITTLQKFPMISESMTQLKGKRFAVIIDEAHSSQTGESSKHLKKVLSVNLEEAEEEDRDDFDIEDEIIKEIRYRGKQPHISYFAFTATPKGKTLELFGHKNESNQRVAFHTYSMRQAIEEHFILDVLKNYTTFKRYFKLVKKAEGDKEYEKKKTLRLLMSYVDLHPHQIELKTGIILDHFVDKSASEIQGRARAMVVTRSRLHAVRFFLSFKKKMKELGLTYKPLVAFSGTVKDPDTGGEHTEKSLNQLQPKVSIVNAYKMPEYRILVVANKFQTGFDEPLLHTMYVDKRLGGVNAVQTLSRLNRTMSGKDGTFILDFVNEVEDIQLAFQDYYQATFLDEETDPDKLYDLETELDGFSLYTKPEVESFAEIFFHPFEPMEKLQPILDAVVERWQAITDDTEKEDFRSILQSYIRLYGYVSQIISFKDIGLEKLYVFARGLNRKLPKRKGKLPYEVIDAVDLDSLRIQKTFEEVQINLEKQNGGTAVRTTTTKHTEDEKDLLSNIIKTLNDIYGVEFNDEDKSDLGKMHEKLHEHEELRDVMSSDNTLQNMRYKFDKVVDDLLLDFVHNKLDLYKKLTDPQVNAIFKSRWFNGYLRDFQAPVPS